VKDANSGETVGMTLRLSLLALCLACAPVFADETPTPTPTPTPSPSLDPKEQASLRSFGAAHLDCKEWSDGCAVCKRDETAHCSLPGIACQPVDITCKTP
jgi:hypothetical protein